MTRRYFLGPAPVSQQNLDFSDVDKAVLILVYPRAVPHAAALKWTIEHALSIVGVPEELQAGIIGDRSADGVRARFVEWNKTTHSLPYCVVM